MVLHWRAPVLIIAILSSEVFPVSTCTKCSVSWAHLLYRPGHVHGIIITELVSVPKFQGFLMQFHKIGPTVDFYWTACAKA